MYNLKIGEKEFYIKFGYKPTLKSGIITKMIQHEDSEGKKISSAEDLMLFIPEVLLVGLQRNHKDEFGYNYDTNERKKESLDKVFDLMDEYFDNEDANLTKLYADLQQEMFTESFLKSLFQDESPKEEASVEQEEKTAPKN